MYRMNDGEEAWQWTAGPSGRLRGENRRILGSSQHLVRKFTGFFSKKSVKLGRGLSL